MSDNDAELTNPLGKRGNYQLPSHLENSVENFTYSMSDEDTQQAPEMERACRAGRSEKAGVTVAKRGKTDSDILQR